MRTGLDHRLHLPQHPSSWWVSHTVAAVAVGMLVVYAAAVLLVLLLRAVL